MESTAEIKVCDKTSKEVIGVCYIKLKDYKDQVKTEEIIDLKQTSGSQIAGKLRIRIRVLWSKLTYFQNQIVVAEEKLQMAHNESNQITKYLNLLDEPFGIITYGLIEDIISNDILEVPKEKEEIVQKQRLSVLPTSINVNKSKASDVAEKIDMAFRGTFSK